MSTQDTTELLSIGDVAESVSLSIDTIRVWERRYGKPVPVRLPSGHRRYTEEHVRWLRRIADALSRGHRPSKVVRLSEEELSDLLGPEPAAVPDATEIRSLLGLVKEYRAADLRARLADDANRLGPRRFVTRRVAPLVEAVGRQWADGELDVRHEHFASSALEDVLRRHRLSLREDLEGPHVLLTTLPGESHGLGLQMAALFAAVGGARVTILGTNTPLAEIAAAVRELDARAVCLSVSLSTAGVATDRVLAELRGLLPSDVDLVVGGRGAKGVRRGPRGVRYIGDLDEFESVIESWRNPH